MIARELASQFNSREKEQGRRLTGSLRDRYQKTYRHPERQLAKLKAGCRLDLGCTNPYARGTWFRVLGGELCSHLQAHPPRMIPNGPVFHLTLIDSLLDPQPRSYDDGLHRETLRSVMYGYEKHLYGLNYVGMVDFAMYVSSGRIVGSSPFYCIHVHALVWGISERRLERIIKRIRGKARSLLPYTTPVECSQIGDRDLLQMLWYVTKAPRNQYQAWARPSERIKQFKRTINGVNSVRLHREIGKFSLSDLTLAGGEGSEILSRARAEIERRRFRAQKL